MLLFFFSCKKNDALRNSPEVSQSSIKIDSLVVEDSTQLFKTVKLNYKSSLRLFPELEGKKVLDSIYFKYKGNKDFSKNGLEKALQTEKNNYYAKLKDLYKDDENYLNNNESWMQDFGMKVKSNQNNYMYIQYRSESFWGGAHSNYVYTDKVFDLQNDKKVELSDITSMPSDEIEKLLKEKSKTISKGNDGNNKPLMVFDELYDTKNKLLLNNFYFDDKNLYFHYSQEEVAPYVIGDIVIPISWEELKGKLNPEFQKRMKIN